MVRIVEEEKKLAKPQEVPFAEKPSVAKKRSFWDSKAGTIIRAIIIIGVLGMMIAILLIGIFRGA